MVMSNLLSRQMTIKPKLHNSISNKINKYIMMTRTIRSTMMSMAKLITTKINSNMLTMGISNTISSNNTMTTIIISIDMRQFRCHQVIDIF